MSAEEESGEGAGDVVPQKHVHFFDIGEREIKVRLSKGKSESETRRHGDAKIKSMKVHIRRPEKEWGPVRQTIFWIFFCIVLMIASFEAGYLVKTFEKDQMTVEIKKLNSWVMDHGGRIEAIETTNRREKTGSGRPKDVTVSVPRDRKNKNIDTETR